MGWDAGRYIGKNNAANGVDTSSVTGDADGSVLERLEIIQTFIGATSIQLETLQSVSTVVEEDAYVKFSIGMVDIDSGAVASANIDITAISNVVEKSTGGAAFSSVGITQPTFSKADGVVYCDYKFLAAEWAAGDMYKLTVNGVVVTVGGSSSYVPVTVWSNLVTEDAALHTAVAAIPGSGGSVSWNATALAAIEGECEDALQAKDLDHLVTVADGGSNLYPDSVVQDSIIAYILAKGNPALATSYNNTTDSLEAIRDRIDTLNLADQVDLDAILADTITISGGALPAAPTANSLAAYIASGGTALGQELPDSQSIVDLIGDFTGPHDGAVQDDNIKASLDLAHTDLDDILADTITISGGTLPATPTSGSLATFISGGSTALGQPLPASTSLVDIVGNFTGPYNGAAQDDNIKASLDLLHSSVADTTVGKTQIIEVSITSAANAGDVTLATITTQPCLVKSVIIHADTASQTDLTSIGVYGGASKVVTFLSTTDGAVANLDAVDEQVSWTGAVRLAATKTIVATLTGTGATAVDLTATIEYCACVDGGYLV